MEHRLVLLDQDATHAVHAAHVVDAVHRSAPFGGGTFATPTIASRVTSAASCSSGQPSVPAGRSGKTRYRSSAVESHTRTSTSSLRLSPSSARTPRGSMTARARYADDLDQTVGNPWLGDGYPRRRRRVTTLW